ncbi:very short patch repair endonuclease [Amycolatopsis sp. MEPSY49]|uniref:very short patch repair endonuclease n=1 Tax=Amycolatopsis sp. MEPSY49 TaxID=3151600 RepID=UPI003EF1710B
MSDFLTPQERSVRMAAVKGRDTKPELALRRLLRDAGLTGYRVDLRAIPGRPDVAFTRWKVAVFVDGAFWHGHPSRIHPDRLSVKWLTKIERNQRRDAQVNEELRALGWSVVRIWDHDLRREPAACVERVRGALAQSGRVNGAEQHGQSTRRSRY